MVGIRFYSLIEFFWFDNLVHQAKLKGLTSLHFVAHTAEFKGSCHTGKAWQEVR